MEKQNNLSSLNLIDLDFFELKNSLKNYLRSQKEFKDYDFNGPNMSVLLDLLSHNTQKNAFFINMALSESFIDSAQIRSSIISHAKELNYTPRSSRSSMARVKVSFDATGESSPYIIQKGSPFSTLIKSESFVFTIPETMVVSSANNTYEFEADIYEGVYLEDVYLTIDSTDISHQRFKITNKNVDTQSLTVTVFEDGSEIGNIYKEATSLLGLSRTSKVYFLQMTEDNYYEIIFGNNILGKKPKSNSRVILSYRISNGIKANGAREFSMDFDPTGSNELLTSPIVDTLETAINGAQEEDIESIRYYAPRHFQVQERTVVSQDYEISLKTQFPEINVVSVYGGEEATPPQFGKIFVAVDISNVDGLPESKKTEYYKFIKSRSPLTIEPVIIEPQYMYLRVESLIKYNINLTTNSKSRIKTLVTNTIDEYNKQYLNDFNSVFRNSNFVRKIDDSDVSIVSNSTDVKMYKKVLPLLGITQTIKVDFDTQLKDVYSQSPDKTSIKNETTISSSPFKIDENLCKLIDDGEGNLKIVKIDGEYNIKILNAGTVDYDKGELVIDSFKIDSFEGNHLFVYAKPLDKDIKTMKNTIMQIEPSQVFLEIEAIQE